MKRRLYILAVTAILSGCSIAATSWAQFVGVSGTAPTGHIPKMLGPTVIGDSGLVPANIPSYGANVVAVITHVDGTGTAYTPVSNTDVSRGAILSTAVAALQANEKLSIAPSTFSIAAGLTIPFNGVSIVGSGYGTHIYIPNSTNAMFDMIVNDSVNATANISVAGLRLDGNNGNNTTGQQRGIVLTAASSFRVQSNWIEHLGRAATPSCEAIIPIACVDGTIELNIITDVVDGINTNSQCERLLVANNNVVSTNRDYGINAFNVNHSLFIGNVIRANKNGINVLNSSFNSFTGNSIIQTTTGDGIAVSASCTGNDIEGNFFQSCAVNAINNAGATNTAIVGNCVIGAAGSGSEILDGGVGTQIYANVTSAPIIGILLGNGTTYAAAGISDIGKTAGFSHTGDIITNNSSNVSVVLTGPTANGLTLASNLANATGLAWSVFGTGNGNGSVTSVALSASASWTTVGGSPITGAGTFTLSNPFTPVGILFDNGTSPSAATLAQMLAAFGNQTASTFLRGPFSPSAQGAVTFGILNGMDLNLTATGQIPYNNSSGNFAPISVGAVGQLLSNNGTLPVYGSLSVASANGLGGSFSASVNPTLTLTTSITGMLKGNGTAVLQAVNGIDFTAGTASLGSGLLWNYTGTGTQSTATGAQVVSTFANIVLNTTNLAYTGTSQMGYNGSANTPQTLSNTNPNFTVVTTGATGGGFTITPPYGGPFKSITVSSGTITLDASTAVNFKFNMTANETLIISNLADGEIVRFIATQDATGGRTLTLGTGIDSGGLTVPGSGTANSVAAGAFLGNGTASALFTGFPTAWGY